MGRLVRFGVFQVDLDTGDLTKQGMKVRLRGKPLDILTLLLERPGELVSRERLKERLWAADTFVDFDHGVNTAVNRLREALGDAADSPRFVETIPRKGYRFIAPIALEGAAPLPAPAPRRERPSPLVLAALGAVAFALAALAILPGWRARGRPDGPTRIAVLPFRNVSGDSSQDYLADGLTDALISDLARIRALRVTSRTSAMSFKGTAKRLPEVARELGVSAVVEGSVLRSGERVRVTAQLVEASGDRPLWADSYERDIGDILGLQREVARSIALGVEVTVTPQEERRLTAAASVDPRAYEAYLRGLFFWERMTSTGFGRSIASLQEAIAIDPKYAPAWAALAETYWIMGTSGYEERRPAEVVPRAREAASQAMALDPTLAGPYATLAEVAADFDWDFAKSEELFRKAIELNPSFADARVSFSALLTGLGRFDEAVAEAKRAQELDPLSVVAGQTLGYRLYYAKQLDRALLQFRRTLELDPRSFPAIQGLAQCHWEQGERRRALVESERAVQESGGNAWVLGWRGYVLAASGDAAGARRALARLEAAGRDRYVSPVYPAMVAVGLRENDRALGLLERAFEERSPWMLFLAVEPLFEPLRPDPRFRDLLRRVGHKA
ncbi:MAG TPA: winged helix-turn-helix domain-containing protein [Vicinamibacteria bacterium]|nr:winged helix-turn-helix domain-containing protein [Vicinamibacteria bacterium]